MSRAAVLVARDRADRAWARRASSVRSTAPRRAPRRTDRVALAAQPCASSTCRRGDSEVRPQPGHLVDAGPSLAPPTAPEPARRPHLALAPIFCGAPSPETHRIAPAARRSAPGAVRRGRHFSGSCAGGATRERRAALRPSSGARPCVADSPDATTRVQAAARTVAASFCAKDHRRRPDPRHAFVSRSASRLAVSI